MATEAGTTKRAIEDDTTSEERAAKRIKADVELESAAEQQEHQAEAQDPSAADVVAEVNADVADDGAGEAEAEGEELAATTSSCGPVKLGYRVFSNGKEASDYISEILKKAKPGDALNEVSSCRSGQVQCSLYKHSQYGGVVFTTHSSI